MRERTVKLESLFNNSSHNLFGKKRETITRKEYLVWIYFLVSGFCMGKIYSGWEN